MSNVPMRAWLCPPDEPKPKVKIRLQKPSDFAPYLQDLMGQVASGDIPANRARVLLELARVLLECYRVDQLEMRLAVLEGQDPLSLQ